MWFFHPSHGFVRLIKVAPNSGISKKGIVNDAANSGVLLALAASLALGATTVAAKDDVGGGWGRWRRRRTRARGVCKITKKKKNFFKKKKKKNTHTPPPPPPPQQKVRSRASCMRPSLGLERSAFPSLPLAPRLLKSRLSHRRSTAAPRKVAAVCGAHEALSKKDAGRCLASLSFKRAPPAAASTSDLAQL